MRVLIFMVCLMFDDEGKYIFLCLVDFEGRLVRLLLDSRQPPPLSLGGGGGEYYYYCCCCFGYLD